MMVTFRYTGYWGNMKKTVLQVMITTLLWRSETDGACTKVITHANFDKAVEVEGTCFYAFSNGWQYSDAETLCSDEGMRLAHYEDETKQLNVWTALGSAYNEHWMGLKMVGGSWQWWDATTGSGTSMTSARWQTGQSSGECARTSNSNMGGKWVANNLDGWYRPVCEDASGSVEATTEGTTTTTTVPPVTTTENTSSCRRHSYVIGSGTMMTNYKKNETLSSVSEIGQMKVVSVLDCARRCLSTSLCCAIVFNRDLNMCRHFQFGDVGTGVTCSSPESCYINH